MGANDPRNVIGPLAVELARALETPALDACDFYRVGVDGAPTPRSRRWRVGGGALFVLSLVVLPAVWPSTGPAALIGLRYFPAAAVGTTFLVSQARRRAAQLPVDAVVGVVGATVIVAAVRPTAARWVLGEVLAQMARTAVETEEGGVVRVPMADGATMVLTPRWDDGAAVAALEPG